jgi:hypothetical protein
MCLFMLIEVEELCTDPVVVVMLRRWRAGCGTGILGGNVVVVV